MRLLTFLLMRTMSGSFAPIKLIIWKGDDVVSYNKLSFEMIQGKKAKIVSSAEALKDITPIKWSSDVTKGNKKVIISHPSK